jgi:hypothetical protein
MALRDQPYLPLYIQDFLTDEKLSECSAATTGVYIRLMCIMHKSDEYGTILLRQKDQQTDQPIVNFAIKLVRSLPYSEKIIFEALTELISEEVLILEGCKLIQKRMVRDNEVSEKRSHAGSKGGFATAKVTANHLSNPPAKAVANTENENEYESENKDSSSSLFSVRITEQELITLKGIFEIFRLGYPGTKKSLAVEFENFKKKNPKDWKEIVLTLSDRLQYQIVAREEKAQANNFVPQWKNLSTWINGKCWTEEISITDKNNEANRRNNNRGGATDQELADIIAKNFGSDSQVRYGNEYVHGVARH